MFVQNTLSEDLADLTIISIKSRLTNQVDFDLNCINTFIIQIVLFEWRVTFRMIENYNIGLMILQHSLLATRTLQHKDLLYG